MKKAFALGVSLLVTTFALSLSASAATVLAAKNGMTLYVFDKDVGGKPSCYGGCAEKWPPYAAKAGEKMGEDWKTVKRTDGSLQWTYDDKPVYFYAPDKKKGDKTGDGVGGVWHIISE
jgi:predicted lipoprotein with Yx(FWY)xxD motif